MVSTAPGTPHSHGRAYACLSARSARTSHSVYSPARLRAARARHCSEVGGWRPAGRKESRSRACYCASGHHHLPIYLLLRFPVADVVVGAAGTAAGSQALLSADHHMGGDRDAREGTRGGSAVASRTDGAGYLQGARSAMFARYMRSVRVVSCDSLCRLNTTLRRCARSGVWSRVLGARLRPM